MRHLTVIAFILLAVCHFEMVSQSCLPDGITFTTQSQIDSFPINYPGCTEIEGYVHIEGGSISNLYGLSCLTSIGSDFTIYNNNNLSNLLGLDSLSTIGGNLDVIENNYIPSLTGLNNLIFVGGDLKISDNGDLHSVTGLENLTYIGGSLRIEYQLLQNLQGLSGLDSIGGDLLLGYLNVFTDDFSGLEGLTSIGGNLSIGITVMNSLSGLENINPETIIDLHIVHNDGLSTCELQNICTYLANPNGWVDIRNNSPGCNNPEEVLEACVVGVPEIPVKERISAYPNPFTTSTTIEYELKEISNIQYTIYNVIGEVVYTAEDRVMPQGSHKVTWSPGHLPRGMYYAVVRSEDGVSVIKMIKQ